MAKFRIQWSFEDACCGRIERQAGVFECEAENRRCAISRLLSELKGNGVVSSPMDIYRVKFSAVEEAR